MEESSKAGEVAGGPGGLPRSGGGAEVQVAKEEAKWKVSGAHLGVGTC